MERCVIVDYGNLPPQPPHSPIRQLKKGPIQAAVTSESAKNPIANLAAKVTQTRSPGRGSHPREDMRQGRGFLSVREGCPCGVPSHNDRPPPIPGKKKKPRTQG